MKASQVIGAVVNVAVIVLVGAYFMERRGAGDSASASERFATVELSSEEWNELIDGVAVLGDVSATPEIIEFIDYQCPFCISSRRQVQGFVRANPDVAVAIRHFPLPMHPQARPAAEIAICSERVNRFQEVHDLLLGSDGWHLDPDWETTLLEIMNADDVRAILECTGSPEVEERIEGDINLAKAFGVRATPTFMSQDTYFPGALDQSGLEQLVERSR